MVAISTPRQLAYAKAYQVEYRKTHPQERLAYHREWRKTPRGRWHIHKQCAKARGVEFLLTFDQWWAIWQESGHWEGRGHGRDAYCMCRIGDLGPYAVGNVFIATHRQNVADANRMRFNKPGVSRCVASNLLSTKAAP